MFLLLRALKNRCYGLTILMAMSGSAFAQIQDDGADVVQDATKVDENGNVIEHLEGGIGGINNHYAGASLACRRYDANPSLCQRQLACSYDYRYNACLDSGNGGGGLACQRFNRDYRTCVNSGCNYDSNSGVCYGNQNPYPPQPYPPQPYPPQPYPPQPYPPQPNPYPSYCSQYTNNQYQCQSAGCFYDHRNGNCFQVNRPQPVPGPGPFRFACTAADYGYEEHQRGHTGIGVSQYDAEQAAMGECLRYHGSCRITDCRQQ